MNKFFALAAVLGFAGAAPAQMYIAPRPAQRVVPAGGAVYSQPYPLTQSVLGGTVVGMPTTAGTVYPQPFTTTYSGGTVVGGSYMVNGSVPGTYTTYPMAATPAGYSAYPTGTVYPQPMPMPAAGTVMPADQMMTTSAPVPYTVMPYTTTSAPVMTSQNGVVTQVVTTPARFVRRVFRR